jgi:hypothetical protein
MNSQTKQPDRIARRGLFRAAVRGGAVCVATVGAVLLSLRNRKPFAASQASCTGGGVCRGCGVVNHCPLPTALSYRAAKRKDS